MGFDLGLIGSYETQWGVVRAGVSMSDVGHTEIAWTGTDHNPTNHVPWINRLGVSGTFLDNALLLAAEAGIAIGRSHLNYVSFATEVKVVPQLAIRGGGSVNSTGSIRFTAGGTVRWSQLVLDYAYVPHEVLGGSHVFSFGIDLATWDALPW